MKKFCTYLTKYSGNKLPPFYIGSTTIEKIESGYKGSVLSQEYGSVFEEETKSSPHLFKTIILTTHETREQAYKKEHFFHRMLNVVSNELYMNKSYADGSGRFGGGFKGKSHTDEHKAHMSTIMKGRINTWTGKKRPEHSEMMKGNQYKKGKKSPESAERMKGNTYTVNTRWWNNGKVNKRSAESPGFDFVPGRLHFNGQWWNNGKVSKRSIESPGFDFVLGRLTFRNKS